MAPGDNQDCFRGSAASYGTGEFSQLQDELEAADRRLHQTAQNFSLEWKAFLEYAIKIKEDAASFAIFPDRNALEDLLLRSQSGLVMMRQLEVRRKDKWKHLLPWREETEPHHQEDSILDVLESSPESIRECSVEDGHRTFRFELRKFLDAEVRVCSVFLTRTQDWSNKTYDHMTTRRKVTQLLRQALTGLHELVDITNDETGGYSSLSGINQACADMCLRFQCHQQRSTLLLDRFLICMRWMLKSRRYFLRQRTLEILRCQEACAKPLPENCRLEKARVSSTTKDGAQCPHFPVTMLQMESALAESLSELGAALKMDQPIRMKLLVDEHFGSTIKESSLEAGRPTSSASVGDLQHSPSWGLIIDLLDSRWKILQLSRMLKTDEETDQSALETQGGRRFLSSHSEAEIDTLLRGDWQLLSVDDVDFIKASLENQSKCHWRRSLLEDTDKSCEKMDSERPSESDSDLQVKARRESHGFTDKLDFEHLDAFYKARYLACRLVRKRLLRAINYQYHLVRTRHHQLAKVTDLLSSKSTRLSESLEAREASDWTSRREGADYIVCCNGVEHFFEKAQADLEGMELQLLTTATIFLRKHESKPQTESQSSFVPPVVLGVDRMQVLCDAYNCELKFQLAKIDLALQIIASGYDSVLSGPTEDYIARLLQSSVLVDRSHSYFITSYSNAMMQLDQRINLFADLRAHRETASGTITCNTEEEAVFDAMVMGGFVQDYFEIERKILLEADEIWFESTSVSANQALKQAIYEEIFILWKSIAASATLTSEGHSLEAHYDTLLCGTGWRVFFSPLQVQDAYIALEEVMPNDINEQSRKIACCIEAVYLLKWRWQLRTHVFETHILEEALEFQANFVRRLESRILHQSSQRFSKEIGGTCLGSTWSSLTPIFMSIRSQSSRDIKENTDRRSRTTRDWIATALRERLSDVTRSSFAEALRIQVLYKCTLEDLVNLQDLTARDMIDFAASAPFQILAVSNELHQSSTYCPNDSLVATSLQTVKSKYMGEIAEVIRGIADRVCVPYWISLSDLQSLVRTHYHSAFQEKEGPWNRDDVVIGVIDQSLFECLAKILRCKTTIPHFLVRLDRCICPLRNEINLMEGLLQHNDVGSCAFRIRPDLPGFLGASSTLTQWLIGKLAQIKRDIQTKPSSERLTQSTTSWSRNATNPLDASFGHCCGEPTLPQTDSSDKRNCLLLLPTTEQLIVWALERTEALHTPTKSSDAGNDVSRTLEDALFVLTEIYDVLQQAISILWKEAALGLHLGDSMKRMTSQQCRRLSVSPIQYASAEFGRDLLRSCQIAIHRSIVELTDRVVSRIQIDGSIDIFDGFDGKDARRIHGAAKLRAELRDAVKEIIEEVQLRVRCSTISAMIESFAFKAPQRHSEQSTYQRILMRKHRNGGPKAFLFRSRAATHSPAILDFRREVLNIHDKDHLETLVTWLETVYALVSDKSNEISSLKSVGRNDGDLGFAAYAVQRYEELETAYGTLSQVEATGTSEDCGEDFYCNQERYGLQHRQRSFNERSLATNDGRWNSPLYRFWLIVVGAYKLSRHRSSLPAPVLVGLPSRTRLTQHIELLRAYLSTTWINNDINSMQQHYESLLSQKHRFYLHQQQQRQCNAAGRPNGMSTELSLSIEKQLQAFSPYYKPTNDGGEGVFFVPAQIMAEILRLHSMETKHFYEKAIQVEALNTTILEERCNSLRMEMADLQDQVNEMEKDEALKREAYTADRCYELQLSLNKLKQDRLLQDVRFAQQQQQLKADLARDFETRLSEMHIQIVSKQLKFNEFRRSIEHDLKQQLRTAQPQLVSQLVDQSGSMSIETKTSFLESLQGQAASDYLQKENIALKQTLLKLQSLYEMQQQTKTVQEERERLAYEAHRMQNVSLENENARLQHQVDRFESELAKLSKERTFFQLQCSDMQRKNQEFAQRRREAKIRALSAPYLDGSPVIRCHTSQVTNLCQQKEENDLDEIHEIRFRNPQLTEPKVPKAAAEMAEPVKSQRNIERIENSNRHYKSKIKRLQQQLEKEMKVKNELSARLTDLQSILELDGSPPRPNVQSSENPCLERPLRKVSHLRAASASIISPRKMDITPKRPCTSRSARGQSALAVSPSSQIASEMDELPSSGGRNQPEGLSAPVPPPSSASLCSHRKYSIQLRDPPQYGVAGVQNSLVKRGRLPYR